MDFNGKIVYVVGGSSGIGFSIARMLASEGSHVMIFARDRDRLEHASEQIASCRTSKPQRFSFMQMDVSSKEEVEAVMSEAVSQFGVPEVLVNSAGVARPLRFENITYEQFDQTMKINLYGTRNTISALLPHMKKLGGYIVNISSMSGLIGIFGYTDYSASKFALIGFSEALRSELGPYGITVSVLCPPDTDTPGLQEENKTKPEETRAIAAKAKLMHPDEVARALIKGMKKHRFLIIPNFEARMIFMGKRLFPSIVEFLMNRDIRKVQKRKL